MRQLLFRPTCAYTDSILNYAVSLSMTNIQTTLCCLVEDDQHKEQTTLCCLVESNKYTAHT